MTAIEDRDYWLRRAGKERDIASTSTDPVASLAHRRLAETYERHAAELSETIALVPPAARS